MNTKIIESFKAKGIGIIKEPDFPSVYSDVMGNLGNPDSIIREGCLDVLWELIESGELPNSTLMDTGDELTRNLSRGLGEDGTDSVFLRTFSALLVGVIVSEDEIRRQKRTGGLEPFLSPEKFTDWYAAAKKYVLEEKDCRGHIEGKGWAHSVSHGADLLRDFAFHRFTAAADHLDILKILSARLTQNTEEININNDDNRLARVVITIMLRGELDLAAYENWLDDLPAGFEGKHWRDFAQNREKAVAWFNATTFLRALYFGLLHGVIHVKDLDFYKRTPGLDEEVRELVLQTLIKMDDGLNYRK